jgi:hypothetical protein
MRELDIRLALFHSVRDQHAGDPDTLIVEELGLCEGVARVDLAVVNGMVHGFEIKSAQDTLLRLPTQREVYNKALDRVTMVVDRRHVSAARTIIPRWWGVLEAFMARDGLVKLKEIRKPLDNPNPDPFAQAQLLWRSEALEELAMRSLDNGLRSKPRRFIWQRLTECLSPSELGEVVRRRLKNRDSWRVEAPRE